MDTVRLSLQGAWELLYTGLILGAGLPILFALGVRLIAGREVATADAGGSSAQSTPGALPKMLAGLCFALVALGVITGIITIIGAGLGKELSFENVYPTLVPK
jgi:hypothetical protein